MEFTFEKLNVYNQVLDLITYTYRYTHCFPEYEKYGLCSQLQRAIVSVASNIAEGSGRKSYKEKIHFIEIAYGSLMEAYAQYKIALKLTYINEEALQFVQPIFFSIARQLSALRQSFQTVINDSNFVTK